MTARKAPPRSSAIEAPATVDVDYCAQQAARMLLTAEHPLSDSDHRALYMDLADAWARLAVSIKND